MRQLVLGALLLLGAGCKSNPYCLNCKDSGNGVIAPADMTPGPDLAGSGAQDLSGPDMVGPGGPCAPTNGGVEICDGIDNDCNGAVDDVAQSRLIGDPKNCGACGNECKYNHAFGQCIGGFDAGTPQCKLDGCQPGYVDRDGDPTNGCEYVCTPTNGGVEICDGKDNNCDGQVDEDFTTSWIDGAHQMPLYDKTTTNCGQCGIVCSLGAGTVMGCTGTGVGGRGQCVVTGCFNGDDGNGDHQTYRHDPAAGSINVTGCEYHCPKPANETGVDCNADGSCTFPGETCNGFDDDCDFTADDNLTEPGLGGACPDGMPGKLCTSGGANPTCGKGACTAGVYQCVGGGLRCTGSVGPSPELCDGADNDCNGKKDDPFTATWDGSGNPRYDSDPHHCGGCAATNDCKLANATNTCRVAAGDTLGSCAVLACNVGYAYVTHTDSDPAKPTCDVTTSKPRDSTQATTGAGCFYKCGAANNSPEICDALDNDCDGCINNGLTAPAICANKGVCDPANNGGKTIAATCQGDKGWVCDYSTVPNVSLDCDGNLTATELQCDTLDNNCNGPCDENFPDTALPMGGTCTNAGRAAKSCSAGLGACQATAPFACKPVARPACSVDPDPDPDSEQCSAVADTSKAKDELCNGKDDDCNGLVDEASAFTIPGTGGNPDKTFQGWHDPVVQLAVADNPTNPSGEPAHTVYVYQYEASRPDATGTSPGSLSTRACANAGVLPWANVTLAQAQAACAAIKNAAGTSIGRLCTAWEWQEACNGNATPGTHWSMSKSTGTYQAGVCNDQSETEQRCTDATQCHTGQSCSSGHCTCGGDTDCNAGFACVSGVCTGSGAWPTGVAGTTSGSTTPNNLCYTAYTGAGAHDMSGNLFEWTGTAVTLKSGTTAHVTAGPQSGQWTITNLVDSGGNGAIYPTDAGAQLVLSGSGTAGNNGTFDILSVASSSSVVIANAAGAADAGNVTWKFNYNKVRGGSFTSQQGGAVCEFDFDIQKAAFVNTDLGFRCCSSSAP
jgi:formylglycine-generating enzyme required for sulfatase activity